MEVVPSSQSADVLSGRTLDGYEIKERIGRGGMATVYRAIQMSIGRQVALKIMPAELMDQSDFLERFKREVRVIADLEHPHILTVHDYGQIDGRPYIVMSYMGGGTLADRIAKGVLPIAEVVRLVGQVSQALDHAHSRGVIHRDFKPSNVLLDKSGNAYLADFGIARLTEASLNLTGSSIVGTPAYMAPEMADAGEITREIDVYALGVTIYQMLTGQFPFMAETPLRVMLAHARSPIPDVRTTRPDLPLGVSTVLMKAMAKRPRERYHSAGAVSEDLQRAAAGLQIEIAPTIADPAELYAASSAAYQPAAAPLLSPPALASEGASPARGSGIGRGILMGGCAGALVLSVISFGLAAVFILNSGNGEQPVTAATTSPTEVGEAPPPSIEAPTSAPTLAPAEPTATRYYAEYLPLEGCSASRLQIGDRAFVALEGGANGIRSYPDTNPSDNLVGRAEPGEEMEIVGGPACNNRWIMWEVLTDSGIRGWTPEGDGSEYWLVPVGLER